MSEKIYTIVRDYDTVIVLRDPLVDFAVWDPPKNDSSSPAGFNTCGTSSPRPVPNENKLPRRSTRLQHLGNTCRLSTQPAGAEPTASTTHTTDPPPGPQAMDIDTEKTSTSSPPKEIHYLVSSAHLRAASKPVARALSGDWAEGRRDSNGRYRIVVDAWDELAFLILLNIIHVKNNQVTHEPELELLTKIAVLVDYYDCGEAVSIWSRVWMAWLQDVDPVPAQYGRKLMLWMCIAGVFRQDKIWKQATKTAIWTGNEDVRTLGLPISGKAVGKSCVWYYLCIED
jgi:hypothetical protein